MREQDNEFYIGWSAEIPQGFARQVRRYLLALAVLVPAVVALMVLAQRGFSNGRFEYGRQTTLRGVLSTAPAPFLTIDAGKNAFGQPVAQKILLVAPGKFGFRADRQQVADGQAVQATGFLIYHDGKTAMEVEQIRPYSAFRIPHSAFRIPHSAFGTVTLRGELTDPKCLLGVMKPGEGKPHRDCAVRCIAGGIPPVLKVANAGGETEYYLLAGPNGERLNDRLLDYVGDGIQLCGRLEQQDDWMVLYANPNTLQRVNKWSLNPGTMCH